jgi:hypothetical protein
LQQDQFAWPKDIKRGHESLHLGLDLWPARSGKHKDRQFSADEILLMGQTLVSRDQYVKFCFSGIEQGTVVEIAHPIS